MVSVGVRTLKSRLSYYLRLMQAGETVAITLRDRVVGYLSQLAHPPRRRMAKQRLRADDTVEAIIERMKREGRVISGGRYRHRPCKPVKMAPGPTLSEIVRAMRDEKDL